MSSLESEEKSKSDILGDGYGSAHLWMRTSTAQVGSNSLEKRSYYKCRFCSSIFVHFYDQVPNIFEAMKRKGVSETCPPL